MFPHQRSAVCTAFFRVSRKVVEKMGMDSTNGQRKWQTLYSLVCGMVPMDDSTVQLHRTLMELAWGNGHVDADLRMNALRQVALAFRDARQLVLDEALRESVSFSASANASVYPAADDDELLRVVRFSGRGTEATMAASVAASGYHALWFWLSAAQLACELAPQHHHVHAWKQQCFQFFVGNAGDEMLKSDLRVGVLSILTRALTQMTGATQTRRFQRRRELVIA